MKTLPLLSVVQPRASCPRNGLQGNSEYAIHSFDMQQKNYRSIYFVAVILKVLLVNLLAALN